MCNRTRGPLHRSRPPRSTSNPNLCFPLPQYTGSASTGAFARFGLPSPFFFFRMTLIGAGSSASATSYSGKPDGVCGVPTSAGVLGPLAAGDGETALRGIAPARSTTNDAGAGADGSRRSGVRAGVSAGEGMSSSRTIGIASTSVVACPFDGREPDGRSVM
jgi:hypothetical protein